MKKITKQSVLLLLAGSILLASCGVTDLNKKAEDTANSFYTQVQKKDYTAALALCSDRAFSADTKDSWVNALQGNASLLGNIQSFTKTNSGFNVQTATGKGTTVVVVYDVQWQYGKSQDSLILIKENDGSMKVLKYSWKSKETRYMSQLAASEKAAGQYMDAVQHHNYDAAVELCSDVALSATPKDKWENFLDRANTQLGTISSYAVLKDSSTFHIDAKGQAGQGNYYDVFVQSDRGGNKVMEKIVLFQKNYDEPVKLAGHYFL